MVISFPVYVAGMHRPKGPKWVVLKPYTGQPAQIAVLMPEQQQIYLLYHMIGREAKKQNGDSCIDCPGA